MRDNYVAAAVLYAWAAECYTRRRSKAQAVPIKECDTIKIFGCDEALE